MFEVPEYEPCNATPLSEINGRLACDSRNLTNLARLANTLLKDEESARDNHVFACNFANEQGFGLVKVYVKTHC